MDSPMDYEESTGENQEVVVSGESVVCHRRRPRQTFRKENDKAEAQNNKEDQKENKNGEEEKEQEKVLTEEDIKLRSFFEAAMACYSGPPKDYVPPELEPPGPDASREEHIRYAFRKQRATMHSMDYTLPYVRDLALNEKMTMMILKPKSKSEIKHLRQVFDETRAKMAVRKANGEPLIEEKEEEEEEEAPKAKRVKRNAQRGRKLRPTRPFQSRYDPNEPGPSNRY